MDEAARTGGFHPNSIRAWLKNGLEAIDALRPTQMLGEELNRFLAKRKQDRRSRTPPGMIHCLPCRKPQRPAEGMVDYLPSGSALGNLRGLCPDCGRLIHRRVALAFIEAVTVGCEVHFPEGHHSIRGSDGPSEKCDSKKG